jgi:hypothetical protein
VYRVGNRRRQCSICRKTWSIRKKKRGRKVIRVHPSIDAIAFSHQESLRHKAKRLNKSREIVRRRHAKNIDALLRKTAKPKAPPGKLIAIVDAIAFSFKRRSFTFYNILLRSTSRKNAVVMEPVLLEGCETITGWKKAFDQLDDETHGRIIVVVSDGLTGMKNYALQQGWIYQRCHFHLLKTLQTLRGKRWRNVPQKEVREEVYQLVRKLLEVPSEDESYQIYLNLKELSKFCPTWFGLRLRGCLRQWKSFRSYRMYPKLHIPTTTNSVECINRLIRDTSHRTRGFRNPESLNRWVVLQVRTMPQIKCNGHNYQQN